MRTNRRMRRFALGAVAVSVAVGGSSLVSGLASAEPPAGAYTVSPASGSDVSVVEGTTNGTCDTPSPDPTNDPVDGYNAVVVGPIFPKNPPSEPDGHQVVGTTDVGFSTTDPIHFTLRKNFRDLATEMGKPLEPGDYVVTFRCVNQFNGTVFQTFSATFHFTGGPPATAYTVTDQAPPSTSASSTPSASPSPSASPTPTESSTTTPTTTSDASTTPATSTTDAAGGITPSDQGDGTNSVASTSSLANTGAPIALVFIGGVMLLAGGLILVIWLKRPKKAALSEGKDASEG